MRAAWMLPLVLVAACGGARSSTPPPKSAMLARGMTQPQATAPGRGYALVERAASCWMGGLWSDALGEKGKARLEGIERRCDDALRATGAKHDEAYLPMRAIEPRVVTEIAVEVKREAEGDAFDARHVPELERLLYAVADAARETEHARRAADLVKASYKAGAQRDARYDLKIAAAPSLDSATALYRLFNVDAGPYQGAARALGILEALDRVEIARGLPKHLKIYAVRGAFYDLFQTLAPRVPDEAQAPIPTGTWLAYLSETAAAAGHPVPSDAKDPQDRDPLAYGGVLEGFADKLRETAPNVPSGELANVTRAVTARLDDGYKSSRATWDSLKSTRAR